MATAQRVFYETVAVLVFVVLLVAAWILSGYRAERRLAAALETHSQELAGQAAARDEALDRAEQLRAADARERARSEAEAAFNAYAAGVQPAAAARWRRFLNTTRDRLTANPRISFVHLTTPGGYLLTSTDPDLVARGRLDETGDWVLATEALTTRPGEGGVLQLAGPILDGGKPIAFLWMGYDVEAAPATATAEP